LVLAQKLWEKGKRYAISLPTAAGAMGYASKSSTFAQAIATLKSYGLVDVDGSGDARRIVVSEVGQKILGNHRDKPKLIKDAAIAPAIFRELWGRFYAADGLANDDPILEYLRFDRTPKFNESVIAPLVADFKATVEFARLDEVPTINGESDSKADSQADDEIRVGDMVQWESQGSLALNSARRLTGFSDDGEWAFLEGSPTGIPAGELRLVEKAPAAANKAPPMAPTTTQTQPDVFSQTDAMLKAQRNSAAPLAPAGAGVKTETFSLDRGEIVVRFPSAITADDYENVKDWLLILERKFKKAVQDEATKATE
jgi:hypothetical protein